MALAPEVEIDCGLRGIPCEALEDGLDVAEIEKLGEATFARVERLCALLDELEGSSPGRTPARWHFFGLKLLHDSLWLRALLLDRWFDRAPVESIVSFAADTVYARMLPVAAGARGIPHRTLPSAEPRSNATPPMRRVAVRPRFGRQMLARGSRTRRARILALDVNYSIPAIAAELERRGEPVRLLVLPEPVWAPRTAVWHAAEAQPEIRGFFAWRGVDYWPAAAPALREIVERGCAEALAFFDVAAAHFRKVRPRALLLSVAAHPDQRAVCAAAASEGIPAIVARHGELGLRDVALVRYQDADVVSHALCWGSFEAAWLDRVVGARVETRVVGSPYADAAASAPPRESVRVELGIPPERLVVLYVPQVGAGDDWYVSRRIPPDVVYVRSQQEIIRALASQERFDVVVKDHLAASDALARWCEHELPGRVRFLRMPFSDVVNLADAVVVDYPSTALVQALHGRGVVLVSEDPISDWAPGVREHLSAHGVGFVPVEELARTLAGVELRTEPYPPPARAPLLAGEPGAAATRLADAVLEIALRDAR